MTTFQTIEITVSSFNVTAKELLDMGLGALAQARVEDQDAVELRYSPHEKGTCKAPTVSIRVQRDREVIS